MKSTEDKLELPDEEVRRNFKWNFAALSMEHLFFIASTGFTSAVTILPAFLFHLTSSNLIIGLISTIQIIGWTLPQFATARYIEQLEYKKRIVLSSIAGQHLSWLFLAIGIFFTPNQPDLELALFFMWYLATCLSTGVAIVSWSDMLAKVIDKRSRGRLLGFSEFIGGVLGAVSAIVAGNLLLHFDFPYSFVACFLSGFLTGCFSLLLIYMVREPHSPINRQAKSFGRYMSRIQTIMKKDRNFSIFLFANIIISIGAMATAFYTVYAMERFHLDGGEIGAFTAFLLAGQTLTTIFWGYLSDKKGSKLVLELGTTLNITAAVLAALAYSQTHFYIVFAITGAATSANMISSMTIILEFPQPEDRPTYIALNQTLRAPLAGAAPILGGVLAERFQYPFMFLIGSIILALGLTVLIHVKDPRYTRAILLPE